jgi:hypothetical protein
VREVRRSIFEREREREEGSWQAREGKEKEREVDKSLSLIQILLDYCDLKVRIPFTKLIVYLTS